MLLKIKQFIIENKGFKADFVFKDVYINSSKIVSISDYAGIKEFLTAENPKLFKPKLLYSKAGRWQ